MGDQSTLKLLSILIMKAFIFTTLLALATASPLKLKEDHPEVAAVAPVVHHIASVVHHVAPIVHHVAPVVYVAHAPIVPHYAYAAPFPVFVHKLAEEALPVAPTAPVAPVEDTPEVAAAKVTFKAAFDAAAAGEHAALAPVQGPAVYLADTPEVVEAKATFKAAFDAATAGEDTVSAQIKNPGHLV